MTAKPDIGVPYEVRHSTRAKRLQAVVRGGRVEVVVPRWARPAHVRAFVAEAAPWIAKKAATLREKVGTVLPARCVTGATVLLEGEEVALRVETGSGRGARTTFTEELLVRVPSSSEPSSYLVSDEHADSTETRVRSALLSWLRERAREVALVHIETYAPQLGVRPRGLRIKSQKTVWGSCGRTGLINLNWRLIAAPPRVLEYIVVHELCHLKERNHGPRFWRLVADLMPGYEAEKWWLREHGLQLG